MSSVRAMIMAAGRGERMRPLTDTCPKPMLEVHGRPLIEYPLLRLALGGFRDIVINTAWLGDQISERYGSHPKLAGDGVLSVSYSHEGRDFGFALETAGGISRALPMLGDIFWVLAADVLAPQFEFTQEAVERFRKSGKLAHIWLVPNPAHNPKGDFGLGPDGLAQRQADVQYTYSTIGLYHKDLFASLPFGNPAGQKAPLAPLLRAAMDKGLVSAELYLGDWADIGTPERLAQLNSIAALP